MIKTRILISSFLWSILFLIFLKTVYATNNETNLAPVVGIARSDCGPLTGKASLFYMDDKTKEKTEIDSTKITDQGLIHFAATYTPTIKFRVVITTTVGTIYTIYPVYAGQTFGLSVNADQCSDMDSPLSFIDVKPKLENFDKEDKYGDWPTISEEDLETGIQNSSYQIVLKKTNLHFELPTWSGLYFTDVRVDADMTNLDPTNHSNYGLICRGNRLAKKWNNFYRFSISSAGSAWIERYERSQNKPLEVLGYIKFSDSIDLSTQANHLQINCIQNKLTLYINYHKVLEVEDSKIQGGMTGIAVTTAYGPDLRINLDNYRVATLVQDYRK